VAQLSTLGGSVRMENAAQKSSRTQRIIRAVIFCFLVLAVLFAPFLALRPLANSSLFPLVLIAWYSSAFIFVVWRLSRHMTVKPSKKKLACILIGSFLFSVCGLFIMLSLIISWYPPWYDSTTFLKFIFHPTTLLLFVGAWLLFRGLWTREQ
jgi:hypothetical protein